MRHKGIWSAFSIAAGTFVFWAASFGAPVYADTPECEAVFSVICEEGYEKDVEILLTDEETGETVATTVGAGDGYRKTVKIPPGTYTASAHVPDPDKDYEVFVDDRPKEAAGGGTCYFSAVTGSWLYTVEYAGLAQITDESGGPVCYGVVTSEDAESYLMAAENAGPGPDEETDGPQEIEDEQQETDVPETADESAEAEGAMPEGDHLAGQDEETGHAADKKKVIVVLGLTAVVIAGAVVIFSRSR